MSRLPGYFSLLGLGLLILEVASAKYCLRSFQWQAGARRWAVVGAAAAIGCGLAVGSLFFCYPLSEDARIVGFPFAAAAWQRTDAGWPISEDP